MSITEENASRPGMTVPKVNPNLALGLLVLINLFNYIDRQVLSAVEPQIRKELFPPDANGLEPVDAKYWTGWFATAFLLSYMVIAPLFGLLADRISRWWLVGFGVILWTLASGGSGVHWGVSIAAAYWILLLTRCFVGVGEAAYGPVAPAMIADLYPVATRGRVMAWFYLAIPVGGALGYALGGQVVNLGFHWQWAFFCVVPPGIALGVLCFFMRDPPRGQTDHVEGTPTPRLSWKNYLYVLTIPSYTLNTLGMTMMSFAIGGLAFWMPEYLESRNVPGVGPIDARTIFGIITAGGGLVATLSGGLLGDWLRTRFSGSYFLVSGIALLLGFPSVLLILESPFPLAWLWVFAAVFFLFFNAGPTNTILANVVHPSMRSSAYALNILIIHALGDAISPPMIGWITARSGMKMGFFVVSLSMLVGGIFWLIGTKFLQRDTELAPTRLPT